MDEQERHWVDLAPVPSAATAANALPPYVTDENAAVVGEAWIVQVRPSMLVAMTPDAPTAT